MMTFTNFRHPLAALAATVLCAGMLPGAAHANMAIYPMAMSVGGESNASGLIRVYSKSDDIQYVKVQVKRVFDPGMPQEHEEVAAGWNGKQLVVSPAKFALPAGASRAVRITNFSPPEKEEVYRVYFEAVPSPDDDGDSVQKKKAQVSLSLVWGALVRARPAHPEPEFRLSGDAIQNTGNTRIRVQSVAPCKDASDQACTWQAIDRSVFPDASLALPFSASNNAVSVRYELDGVSGLLTKTLTQSH